MKISQYRPCFTEQEILYLATILQDIDNPIAKRLHSKVSTFAIKIRVGLNSPAFISQTKESLESILGIEKDPSLMSDMELYQHLLEKENLTSQEKTLGRNLEIKIFGFDSGSFN